MRVHSSPGSSPRGRRSCCACPPGYCALALLLLLLLGQHFLQFLQPGPDKALYSFEHAAMTADATFGKFASSS